MYRFAPFIALLAFAVISHAAEKTVTSSSELQAALDGASPGDIINVDTGTYNGPFTITTNGTPSSPIVLTTKANKVKIIGSGVGLTINGNYWQVNNLPFSDFDTGVLLKGTGITLDALAIIKVSTGIDVQGQGNSVKNCVAEASKVGIHVGADNTELESNSVKGSDSGILAEDNTCCGRFAWNVASGGIKVQGQNYRSDGNVLVDNTNLEATLSKPASQPPHTFWSAIKNFFSFLG